MLDAEEKKFIKEEIRKHIGVIFSGISGPNTEEIENINNMFPGMPEIPNRPVVHPYGYASRSKKGTTQVTGRMGEHVGNRLVLGHRDGDRPKDLEEGETVIYSMGGMKVYMRNGKIQIGSSTSSDPIVLYNELKILMESILQHIMEHTHIGNMGLRTSPPVNNPDFQEDKDNVPTIQSGEVFADPAQGGE